MRLSSSALVALCLFAFACDDDAAAEGDAGAAVARDTYPDGPFGVDEGALLANLSFVAPDGTPRDLQSFRQDGAADLLLLTTAAGWCTACIEEQPSLRALADDFAEDGLAIAVVLFEDAAYEPADAAFAADWQDRHELDFAVLADPDFQLAAYYDESLTPMNMLVDLDTMEMKKIATGFDESAIRALIGALL